MLERLSSALTQNPLFLFLPPFLSIKNSSSFVIVCWHREQNQSTGCIYATTNRKENTITLHTFAHTEREGERGAFGHRHHAEMQNTQKSKAQKQPSVKPQSVQSCISNENSIFYEYTKDKFAEGNPPTSKQLQPLSVK